MNDLSAHSRMQRLLEVSRMLATAPDAITFLNTLIAAGAELTACELASILELEESGELRFLAVPWFHRDALQNLKVPLIGSIAGKAVETRKPVIVSNVAAAGEHFKGADRATGFTTRSLVAVPICYQEQVLGVLEVLNKASETPFSEEDVASLEFLVAYAAVTMQAMRLARQSDSLVDEMKKLDQMKSEFIAIASHELRTPLGLILGHATFLREVIQPEHRPEMDIIVRSAMRLKEIIESFSNIDNIQRGQASLRRKVFSLKRLIEDVRDSFYQEIRAKNLSLRIASENSSLLMLEGDVEKIGIALSNLVKNAITFTNPGGHILITAETLPGYVQVSVIDDGIGIPLKDLPHIFERFYQVESHLTRKHGGMGLGLSVAKMMIEMHGGRIWAESVEGRGSKFTFLLPLSSQEQPSSSSSTE
jgi:signal transduction histidine kinase